MYTFKQLACYHGFRLRHWTSNVYRRVQRGSVAKLSAMSHCQTDNLRHDLLLQPLASVSYRVVRTRLTPIVRHLIQAGYYCYYYYHVTVDSGAPWRRPGERMTLALYHCAYCVRHVACRGAGLRDDRVRVGQRVGLCLLFVTWLWSRSSLPTIRALRWSRRLFFSLFDRSSFRRSRDLQDVRTPPPRPTEVWPPTTPLTTIRPLVADGRHTRQEHTRTTIVNHQPSLSSQRGVSEVSLTQRFVTGRRPHAQHSAVCGRAYAVLLLSDGIGLLLIAMSHDHA